MFKMIFLIFFQYLAMSTIYCNTISSSLLKVENSEFTLACSKLTAQKITSFLVFRNESLNCFDEFLLISFEIIDIRQQNKTIQEQAYLTKNGCCLAERQLKSKSCKRIRRYKNSFSPFLILI
jgi:hypothetical protein